MTITLSEVSRMIDNWCQITKNENNIWARKNPQDIETSKQSRILLLPTQGECLEKVLETKMHY